MENESVFLVKPYDKLLIRQNPIYKETCFVLEKVNKDLSIHKEEITSYHIPEAKTPEDFLLKLIDHPRMLRKARTSNRYAKRKGWVRVIAPRNISIEELWPMAMKKIGNNELFTINQ